GQDIEELWTGSVPPSTPGRGWDRGLYAAPGRWVSASPRWRWWVSAPTVERWLPTPATTRSGLWPIPATCEHGDDDRRARGQLHRSVPVLGRLVCRHHLGGRGSDNGAE